MWAPAAAAVAPDAGGTDAPSCNIDSGMPSAAKLHRQRTCWSPSQVAPSAVAASEGVAWLLTSAAVTRSSSSYIAGWTGSRDFATLNPNAPGRAGVVNLLMAIGTMAAEVHVVDLPCSEVLEAERQLALG